MRVAERRFVRLLFPADGAVTTYDRTRRDSSGEMSNVRILTRAERMAVRRSPTTDSENHRLGDHREAVLARIRPDLLIGRAAKANQVDAGTVGELISQMRQRGAS
jgi:hypothetical protein